MTDKNPVKPLVIIPTYNERDNIESLIREVLNLDNRLHILVVDDNSPDGTAGAVLDLQKGEYLNRLLLNSRSGKMGLGSAYVHGFNWGLSRHFDFLIQMDADWSHPPGALTEMLRLAGDTDFVVGSRYITGGGTLNWGFGRRILSKFGSFYSRAVLGTYFSDFTGGFNGWSARVLSEIGLGTLKSNGYSFQIELKYRADRLGFRHVEYPIIFDERRGGKSKMSTAIALEAFWRVWQLRLSGGKTERVPPFPRE
jgi:dolichol-phosphate mannosyltransferase